MARSVTRIGRAAMMGLAWAAVWIGVGVVAGPLIVGELEPEHIGGPLYAGVACGAIFSALAGIASGRRRLDELSPYEVAAWGAASGVFVGVFPFVIGDNGNYQNWWSSTIVATSSVAAAIAAGWRRLGQLSPGRAATLVAVVTGLLAGVGPWFLTTQDTIERLLPVALIGGLSVLSAVSAFGSLQVARWSTRETPARSAG